MTDSSRASRTSRDGKINSRPLGSSQREMVGGQIQSYEKRFRKAFSLSYSSPLRLIQAQSNRGLLETRTLAGVGWNELE